MHRIALLATALASLIAPASAQEAPDPSGVWLRSDGNARVEIAPCGGKVCATNLWIRDKDSGEEVGDKLVMTVEPKSSDTLAGTAYDAKRKLNYAITIRVAKDRLVTRGCLVGVLCKSVNWTPAN